MTKKEICHVCGQTKESYTIIMNSDIMGMIQHQMAREDGAICQRCDQYHAMTGEFKDASETEFENAVKAREFARLMFEWWTKDKPLDENTESLRSYPGEEYFAQWCRKHLSEK